MAVVMTGLYMTAIQGRVEGICTVSFKDMVAILTMVEREKRSGAALSSTFKTNSRYGYQPVTISVNPDMVNTLKTYLAVRPRSRGEDAPFFVDFNGNAYTSSAVSKLVTGFYKKTLGLHITTTMIRSLYEIITDKALDEGLITGTNPNPNPNHVNPNHVNPKRCTLCILATEQKAIHNSNGHTSGVTRDYYFRRSRLEDARHGVNALAAMMRNPIPLLPDGHRHLLEWGSEHPHKHLLRGRVPWTPFERRFVVDWCRQAVEEKPAIETKVVKMCLKHIKSKPALVAKFHANHTLDSSRLAYPWKEYKKIAKDD